MSLKIIVDSAIDMDPELSTKLGLTVIPLKVSFGEEEYLDNYNLSHEQFFEKLIETDVFPKTSQINPFEYEEYFKKIADDGDEAIVITLSSKLSGCYQSACIAAEDYSDRIKVVDSLNACVGERILTEYAVRLRDQGKSLTEIEEELNEKKSKIRLVAMIDTLEYLKKGGRISAAAALAGNLLSIKPVISIEEGEVTILGKARGSKAANNKIKEIINQSNGIDFDMPICLVYSGPSRDILLKYMADNKDLYGEEELPISSLGAAIGSHIGPGGIGCSFFEK